MAAPKDPPKARCFGLGSTELCSTIAYEWDADFSALASDGQYWRSVFGGARLVGEVRIPPVVFLIGRLLLLCATVSILFLQIVHVHDEGGYTFWLYFENWTSVLQCIYFGLASLHSFIAIGLSDPGVISRSTPFLVRITELAYGALLPATVLNFCCEFLVVYAHPTCTSLADTTHWQTSGVVSAASMVIIQLLDLLFNRQPYYAQVSAMSGIAFCWAYFLFAGLFEVLGGTDRWGHTYIYRCLDWSFPISGGGVYTTGKLLYLNLYIAVPLINYVYWVLLWARRRALAVAPRNKGRNSSGSYLSSTTSTLLDAPYHAPPRRVFFEYTADYRDLALDGRHWRAQFGGSSGRTPKMGAYVCCGPMAFCALRICLFFVTLGLLITRLIEFRDQYQHKGSSSTSWGSYFFLYYENWVLLLALLYFMLAAVLTTAATLLPGAESRGIPLLVWAVWAAYGALLPSALIQALVYMISVIEINGSASVTFNNGGHKQPPVVFNGGSVYFDIAATAAVLVIVMLDAWVNRQPYYASFHAFLGMFFNYSCATCQPRIHIPTRIHMRARRNPCATC